MQRTLVSIIVPVLNMQQTVGRCIRSILHQDHPGIQIIVVDGRSTDDTVAEVEVFSDHLDVVVSEPDQGAYHAINKGLAHVKGDIVGILNADDYYTNASVISNFVKTFNRHREAGVVFADIEFFSAVDQRPVRDYCSDTFELAHLRFGMMPPHPSIFVRRSVYEAVGGFATHLPMAADFEFVVRALWLHRVPFRRIDDVVVRMQHGGRSTRTWRSVVALNHEVLSACRSHGFRTNWLHILLKWGYKSRGLKPLLEPQPRRRNIPTPWPGQWVEEKVPGLPY